MREFDWFVCTCATSFHSICSIFATSPTYCLLDNFCHMFDFNAIRVEPAACISRPSEIAGETKKKELTLEKSSLVVKNSEDRFTASRD